MTKVNISNGSPTIITNIDDQGDVIYIAEAMVGTPDSAAGWRIRKITTSAPVTVRWAGGNRRMMYIYNNRESLNYL
jgi:hypothetical protein